jgi:hypothetical protein
MPNILKYLVDKTIIVSINDILIDAKNTEQHNKLVEKVLKELITIEMIMSNEICIWANREMECLGYIIPLNRIRMARNNTRAFRTGKVDNCYEPFSQFSAVQIFIGNSYLGSSRSIAE